MHKFTMILAMMALGVCLSACTAKTGIMFNGKFHYPIEEENASS